MNTAAGDEEPLTPDREQLVELIGLHARVLRRMPWVQSLMVIALALFMLRYLKPLMFASWALLTIGVELIRARYAASIRARGHSIDPRHAHWIFALLATASGAAVAVGAILFLPRLPILDQALFGTALYAMPAAGVAVSQSSRYIVACYALSMLIPSAATWMTLHPSQAIAVAGLTILYCALIVTVAADGEQLLLRSVIIRHERDRLVRDLEQRNADVRLAMAQSERSAQSRARVLAAASHDLRQPLHALSVYSAVLAAGPPPETMHEVATNIDQIVRSLGNLLHGLLDLSRLSAGYYALERKPLAVDGTLEPIVVEYRRAAAEKGLTLNADLAAVRVIGDPLAIGRIARNLLDNAVKYTDRGHVTLSVRADTESSPAAAVLSVADSGKGIPPSEHARIFEEFYQLDNPGRDRSKGVGLGLAIVQRLCELSGAHIRVESESGRGTTFHVRLPDLVAEGTRVDVPAALPVRVQLAPRRVWLLDDDVVVRHSMTQLLRLWGADVLALESAQAAESMFDERGAPDLLISDLRLGAGEHGAQLALRLRRRFGHFAVLIITGEVSSAALRVAEEGRLPLLHKPITQESLAAAILSALEAAPRPALPQPA